MGFKNDKTLLEIFTDALATLDIDVNPRLKKAKRREVSYFERESDLYGILKIFTSEGSLGYHPEKLTPIDIGYTTVVSSLSEIAVTGARPQYLFPLIGVSESFREDALLRFFEGVKLACRLSGVTIIGGQVFEAAEPVVELALYGETVHKRLISERSVKKGQKIYVTGTLGDGEAGHLLLQREGDFLPVEKRLVNRFLKPDPRSKIVEQLVDEFSPTLMYSTNGGILKQLKLLCEQNSKGFTLNEAALPVSHELVEYCKNDRDEAKTIALQSERDHELLFISNISGHKSEYIDDTRITLIGEFTDSGYLLLGTNGATQLCL